MDSGNLITILGDLAPQALAAGFGAWAAFRLEAKRQERQENGAHAQDLRVALFALISQRNYLINLDEQVLQRHAQASNRFLAIPALTLRPGYQDLRISAITFLLDTTEASTVSHVELANLRFQTVDILVQERTRLHLELQRRLESGPPPDSATTLDDIRRRAGFALVAQLQGTTDSLYGMTAQALIDNRAAYSRLESALRTLFPAERVPTPEELPPSLPTPV